jgi:hypothetical protein
MKAARILGALAWLFLGCGSRIDGAGSRAQGASDASTPAEPGVIEDGGLPGIGPADAFSTDHQAQAPPPPDLTHRPTVWVGQIDPTVTYPAAWDGGTVIRESLPPSVPDKVVLILDAETNPLMGTVTFGDVGPPPPPTDPNQPYPPAPTMVERANGQTIPYNTENPNWFTAPFPGFSYSLVASTLSRNLLQLAFALPQLWQGWCAIQNSSMPADLYPCICDGGACTSPSSPLLHLTLTVSGDTMQGQLLTPTLVLPSDPPQIRLQRVQ